MDIKLHDIHLYAFVLFFFILLSVIIYIIGSIETMPFNLKKFFEVRTSELALAEKLYNKDKTSLFEKILINEQYNRNCTYFKDVTIFFMKEEHILKILSKKPINAIDRWIQIVLVKLIICSNVFYMQPYEDALIIFLKNRECIDSHSVNLRFGEKVATYIKNFLEESPDKYIKFSSF
ncbi:hypothetical protein COBT_003038 [Conglomerata obtusa]